MSSTPATTNAARYARIVEEYALLRRLIGVAGEIAELGYSVPDDVTKALDRAESLVYEVNERRVPDSTHRLYDLLSENLDRLEALFEKGDSITGTPTRSEAPTSELQSLVRISYAAFRSQQKKNQTN